MNPQRQSLVIRNHSRALHAQSPAMTVHAVTPPADLLLTPAKAVRHLMLKHAQRMPLRRLSQARVADAKRGPSNRGRRNLPMRQSSRARRTPSNRTEPGALIARVVGDMPERKYEALVRYNWLC